MTSGRGLRPCSWATLFHTRCLSRVVLLALLMLLAWTILRLTRFRRIRFNFVLVAILLARLASISISSATAVLLYILVLPFLRPLVSKGDFTNHVRVDTHGILDV